MPQQIDPAQLTRARQDYFNELGQRWNTPNKDDHSVQFEMDPSRQEAVLKSTLKRDGSEDIYGSRKLNSPFFKSDIDGQTYYNEWTDSFNSSDAADPLSGQRVSQSYFNQAEPAAKQQKEEISDIYEQGQKMLEKLLSRASSRYD